MGSLKKIVQIVILSLGVQSQAKASEGILVLAHGSAMDHLYPSVGELPAEKSQCELINEHIKSGGGHDRTWELAICDVTNAAAVELSMPLETAFGMFSLPSFQHAVNRLGNKQVETLKIIPFYVSSASGVIRKQKDMFGVFNQLFEEGKVVLPKSISKVIYMGAMNQDIELTKILSHRAQELSADSKNEEVILVGHGPVSQSDDDIWLRDLKVHADRIQNERAQSKTEFSGIHPFTLKDDAPKEERDRRTKELRELVGKINLRGNRPLVLPVFVAPGGIEKGLLERLDGLNFHYLGHMLAPDPGLVRWIVNKSNATNSINIK